MRYYFLDTSAFVKAFVVEPGERRVRGLIAGAIADPPSCRVIVTDFTFLEATSAILQKREQKKITQAVCNSALGELEKLLRGVETPYVVVEASGVAGDVPEIIRRYKLRPGDAVHIAAALASRHSTPAGVDLVFVTCVTSSRRLPPEPKDSRSGIRRVTRGIQRDRRQTSQTFRLCRRGPPSESPASPLPGPDPRHGSGACIAWNSPRSPRYRIPTALNCDIGTAQAGHRAEKPWQAAAGGLN